MDITRKEKITGGLVDDDGWIGFPLGSSVYNWEYLVSESEFSLVLTKRNSTQRDLNRGGKEEDFVQANVDTYTYTPLKRVETFAPDGSNNTHRLSRHVPATDSYLVIKNPPVGPWPSCDKYD